MCDDLLEEHVYPTVFGDAEMFVPQTEEGMPLRALYVGGGFQSATARQLGRTAWWEATSTPTP